MRLRSGADPASGKQSGPLPYFPDPMLLASGTAGGATLLCEVGLPSGRWTLLSESKCVLLSAHLKGGSRSRTVTIIVARKRRWSSEEGPQVHSKGGATSKRCQKPEDRSSFCLRPIVRSTLSAQNETGHVHAAGPRERSGANQYAAGSSLAILQKRSSEALGGTCTSFAAS